MPKNDLEQKARDSTLRFLSYRPRSIQEVKTHLVGKRYEKAVIDQVIDSLAETGLIDDLQFATWWVQSRLKTGRSGPLRISGELKAKGVSGEIITRATQRDWNQIAREIAEKLDEKLDVTDSSRKRSKIQAFLLRCGFTAGQIASVFNLRRD